MTDSPDKPWGGRFGSATAELMERFNASIGFDRKLLEVDVAASVVYARALARASLLTPAECEQVVSGLKRVRAELAVHGGDFEPRLEDIHMAVEERLTSLIGPLAGKLHTGRSRNDQVNVDERLYLRGAVAGIDGRIARLQQVLVTTAGDSETVVLPGYTHLQQAQPILFSHYALSLFLDAGSRPRAPAGRRGARRRAFPRFRGPRRQRLPARQGVHGAGARFQQRQREQHSMR